MVQTVEAVARLMVADLAAIFADPSSATATARQSTTASATPSPTPPPSTGSTSPPREGGSSCGAHAHVTPKAVAALIERSVEELFAGERGSAGRRCGWERL